MNKSYFCQIFFLTDWRHKRLKNTIDLLLFYLEHFYGFSESVTIIVSFRLGTFWNKKYWSPGKETFCVPLC